MARGVGGAVGAPLDVSQVAVEVARVTSMIEAGNPRAAARALAAVAAAADDATARLLLSCLDALERPRVVGVPKLRHLWKIADGAERELIEALAPRAEAPLAAPGALRATRPADPARGPVSVPSTRQGPARGTRGQGAAAGARDAARYFDQDAEPGGLDALADADDDRRSDYPGWIDDEAPALVPVSGTLCVSCWIERPTAEQHRRDDDGLCSDCRDRGRAGVVVPAGTDRAGRMRARAAHIAERAATPQAARALLLAEWNRARGADRAVIVDYVHQHPDTVAAVATAATSR